MSIPNLTLPVSAKHQHLFVPEEYKDHPEPLTYVVRHPTQRLEGKVRHTMISSVGVMPPDDVMYAELRKALKHIMKDQADDLADVLQVVDRMEETNAKLANLMADNKAAKEQMMQLEQLDADMVDSFTTLVFAVARSWPPYRQLLADRTFYYSQVYGVSAQVYIADVKNAPFDVEYENGMLTEHAVSKIPQSHLQQLYVFIAGLQHVDGGTEKNSESPLKSPPSRKTSPAKKKSTRK
tara:strand:- start:202 stop:912 length:711 start_codon:yes stop_codon:yes gene_type:complete